jgi:type II secretion system protein J
VSAHASQGFTFLELIISLTIFSLVAVIVYATLNLGSRAADRGEARSIENQRSRAALALLTRQLKSAYPLALQAEGETFVYFYGEPDKVSFISAGGRSDVGGLEKITYFIREDQGRRSLWVRTSAPTLPADLLEDREGSLMQETEVLPEIESLTWEYLTKEQDREEWRESWDGKELRKLPTAVRLSWKAPLGELPYEWQMEIPLYVYQPPPDLLGAPQGGSASSRRRRFRGREQNE